MTRCGEGPTTTGHYQQVVALYFVRAYNVEVVTNKSFIASVEFRKTDRVVDYFSSFQNAKWC